MKSFIFEYIERLIALSIFLVLLPFFIFMMLLIKFSSKGPALFWSVRSGINGINFFMPKFRTMRVGTPQVATHLLRSPDSHLTALGVILRKYSLDEIPQLISIFQGKMSFVGPRPALFNQEDLIKLRSKYNIDTLKPGLTGWAQVNGRDELSIEDKVNYEIEYLENRSLKFDFYIIWLTITKTLRREGISH